MEPKRYNARGMEVICPIYYIDNNMSPPIPPSQVYIYHSPEKSLVNFNPSDNFGLKVTRDADFNINVNLRFNPKSFFAFATETITSAIMLKKALSGLV